MDDLISRSAVVKAIDRHTFDTDNGLCLDEDITVILEGVPSVQLEHDRLHPKIYKNFSSCLDCIHSEDSESICILRKCVHAIYELRECYIDKRKETEE